MRAAIFDFDGTLYAGETFDLLMNHLKYHPTHKNRYQKFYRAIMPPYIGYKLKLVPEAVMREKSMQAYLSAFHQLSETELTDYFREVADKMKDNLNQEVKKRMEKHAEQGDFVMLVSGAFTPLLDAVTADLPVDRVIGTQVSYPNGILDKRSPVRHIQSERKIEEIKAALGDREIDWNDSFAYSDSVSDLPILELAGNAVAVQPDERLRTIASKRGWEIL
ncbi:HAD family hydrolase [Planococcus lenghuensis]|uniref:Haloacid dehalogenase n=1 Tax=Planococcus lenghuensis TaxID=2213202 RepID=A0A1Q2L0K7_9BACL|nr:HAD-IB family hydrolase [Planococcus lenghuensis]AQQ53978.1 haloacid dehalogenase [Planococcus lenghuensis]